MKKGEYLINDLIKKKLYEIDEINEKEIDDILKK